MENTVKSLKAHIAINVRDIAASVKFYRKLFGIDPAKLRTGYAKFDLANPPLNFTLNEASFSVPGVLSHLGIQVATTKDVLSTRDRWVREGLIAHDEMHAECCYALQDKAWVRDPDGNEWEVFAVLQDHLPQKPAAGRSCCVSSCCAPAESLIGDAINE